jgi:hypothetical protein
MKLQAAVNLRSQSSRGLDDNPFQIMPRQRSNDDPVAALKKQEPLNTTAIPISSL